MFFFSFFLWLSIDRSMYLHYQCFRFSFSSFDRFSSMDNEKNLLRMNSIRSLDSIQIFFPIFSLYFPKDQFNNYLPISISAVCKLYRGLAKKRPEINFFNNQLQNMINRECWKIFNRIWNRFFFRSSSLADEKVLQKRKKMIWLGSLLEAIFLKKIIIIYLQVYK